MAQYHSPHVDYMTSSLSSVPGLHCDTHTNPHSHVKSAGVTGQSVITGPGHGNSHSYLVDGTMNNAFPFRGQVHPQPEDLYASAFLLHKSTASSHLMPATVSPLHHLAVTVSSYHQLSAQASPRSSNWKDSAWQQGQYQSGQMPAAPSFSSPSAKHGPYSERLMHAISQQSSPRQPSQSFIPRQNTSSSEGGSYYSSHTPDRDDKTFLNGEILMNSTSNFNGTSHIPSPSCSLYMSHSGLRSSDERGDLQPGNYLQKYRQESSATMPNATKNKPRFVTPTSFEQLNASLSSYMHSQNIHSAKQERPSDISKTSQKMTFAPSIRSPFSNNLQSYSSCNLLNEYGNRSVNLSHSSQALIDSGTVSVSSAQRMASGSHAHYGMNPYSGGYAELTVNKEMFLRTRKPVTARSLDYDASSSRKSQKTPSEVSAYSKSSSPAQNRLVKASTGESRAPHNVNSKACSANNYSRTAGKEMFDELNRSNWYMFGDTPIASSFQSDIEAMQADMASYVSTSELTRSSRKTAVPPADMLQAFSDRNVKNVQKAASGRAHLSEDLNQVSNIPSRSAGLQFNNGQASDSSPQSAKSSRADALAAIQIKLEMVDSLSKNKYSSSGNSAKTSSGSPSPHGGTNLIKPVITSVASDAPARPASSSMSSPAISNGGMNTLASQVQTSSKNSSSTVEQTIGKQQDCHPNNLTRRHSLSEVSSRNGEALRSAPSPGSSLTFLHGKNSPLTFVTQTTLPVQQGTFTNQINLETAGNPHAFQGRRHTIPSFPIMKMESAPETMNLPTEGREGDHQNTPTNGSCSKMQSKSIIDQLFDQVNSLSSLPSKLSTVQTKATTATSNTVAKKLNHKSSTHEKDVSGSTFGNVKQEQSSAIFSTNASSNFKLGRDNYHKKCLTDNPIDESDDLILVEAEENPDPIHWPVNGPKTGAICDTIVGQVRAVVINDQNFLAVDDLCQVVGSADFFEGVEKENVFLYSCSSEVLCFVNSLSSEFLPLTSPEQSLVKDTDIGVHITSFRYISDGPKEPKNSQAVSVQRGAKRPFCKLEVVEEESNCLKKCRLEESQDTTNTNKVTHQQDRDGCKQNVLVNLRSQSAEINESLNSETCEQIRITVHETSSQQMLLFDQDHADNITTDSAQCTNPELMENSASSSLPEYSQPHVLEGTLDPSKQDQLNDSVSLSNNCISDPGLPNNDITTSISIVAPKSADSQKNIASDQDIMDSLDSNSSCSSGDSNVAEFSSNTLDTIAEASHNKQLCTLDTPIGSNNQLAVTVHEKSADLQKVSSAELPLDPSISTVTASVSEPEPSNPVPVPSVSENPFLAVQLYTEHGKPISGVLKSRVEKLRSVLEARKSKDLALPRLSVDSHLNIHVLDDRGSLQPDPANRLPAAGLKDVSDGVSELDQSKVRVLRTTEEPGNQLTPSKVTSSDIFTLASPKELTGTNVVRVQQEAGPPPLGHSLNLVRGGSSNPGCQDIRAVWPHLRSMDDIDVLACSRIDCGESMPSSYIQACSKLWQERKSLLGLIETLKGTLAQAQAEKRRADKKCKHYEGVIRTMVSVRKRHELSPTVEQDPEESCPDTSATATSNLAVGKISGHVIETVSKDSNTKPTADFMTGD